MIKKAIKKKVRAKKARKASLSPEKVLAEDPINSAHKTAIAVATRAVKAEARANTLLAKAIAKKDSANERFEKATLNAKTKKTTAAKEAAVKARAKKSSSMDEIKAAKTTLTEASANTKAALHEIAVIKNKEEAKTKAVAVFTNKWEKAYDLKTKKKKRIKRPAKKAAAVSK
ncbi:MAG: hypothetical protein GXP21_09395 [Gammaproteobacteria bacterium]|nr:hypothetical protein [Gammaproteobacteria bacterium]